MNRRSTQHLAGLVAAALVAAAGLVGLSASAASAATCSSSGISTVVDANDGAGGGVSTKCDRVTGSRKAAAVFRDVGVSMERNQDGSVCKVDGKPSNAVCGRLGTTYWALFWSDGSGGSWTYSDFGVDGLTVPKNGSVAWAWQGSSGRRQPSVAPARVQPTPTPAPKPTQAPPKAPSGSTGGGSKPTQAAGPTKAAAPTGTTGTTGTSGTTATASPSAAARAAAKAKARAKASARPSASASPSESASASVSPPSEDSDAEATQKTSGELAPTEQDSGLPVWVPIALILGLGGAAGATVWWRRRSGPA